jgi:hypothetical protein
MSRQVNSDVNMDMETFHEFLEALGAIPATNALPFDYNPIDPAEIMFTQWKPYTVSKTVQATLEDFPEKLKVGMLVGCL